MTQQETCKDICPTVKHGYANDKYKSTRVRLLQQYLQKGGKCQKQVKTFWTEIPWSAEAKYLVTYLERNLTLNNIYIKAMKDE
jgi:hypothetical protein